MKLLRRENFFNQKLFKLNKSTLSLGVEIAKDFQLNQYSLDKGFEKIKVACNLGINVFGCYNVVKN